MLKRMQFQQVFIWGIRKPQHISDDVKLSEPGGGSILTGAITENLSHFFDIKKDLETVIPTFKV